ncbi:hypothetical protein H0H81_011718 [Sphagnurus paluster]|uniref:Uncharacterized protein n=1 Tax=Sphagnurus paluster TaxID=117069 RepID=A0A9P7K3N2_9AGAR|nr:hypothetical protein H0H81_011718 [Sphagnurus paluster]
MKEANAINAQLEEDKGTCQFSAPIHLLPLEVLIEIFSHTMVEPWSAPRIDQAPLSVSQIDGIEQYNGSLQANILDWWYERANGCSLSFSLSKRAHINFKLMERILEALIPFSYRLAYLYLNITCLDELDTSSLPPPSINTNPPILVNVVYNVRELSTMLSVCNTLEKLALECSLAFPHEIFEALLEYPLSLPSLTWFVVVFDDPDINIWLPVRFSGLVNAWINNTARLRPLETITVYGCGYSNHKVDGAKAVFSKLRELLGTWREAEERGEVSTAHSGMVLHTRTVIRPFNLAGALRKLRVGTELTWSSSDIFADNALQTSAPPTALLQRSYEKLTHTFGEVVSSIDSLRLGLQHA